MSNTVQDIGTFDHEFQSAEDYLDREKTGGSITPAVAEVLRDHLRRLKSARKLETASTASE